MWLTRNKLIHYKGGDTMTGKANFRYPEVRNLDKGGVGI